MSKVSCSIWFYEHFAIIKLYPFYRILQIKHCPRIWFFFFIRHVWCQLVFQQASYNHNSFNQAVPAYLFVYLLKCSIVKQWQAVVKKKGGNVGQICHTWATITWRDRLSFCSGLRIGVPQPSIRTFNKCIFSPPC